VFVAELAFRLLEQMPIKNTNVDDKIYCSIYNVSLELKLIYLPMFSTCVQSADITRMLMLPVALLKQLRFVYQNIFWLSTNSVLSARTKDN
jgi:hypothetical protein